MNLALEILPWDDLPTYLSPPMLREMMILSLQIHQNFLTPIPTPSIHSYGA